MVGHELQVAHGGGHRHGRAAARQPARPDASALCRDALSILAQPARRAQRRARFLAARRRALRTRSTSISTCTIWSRAWAPCCRRAPTRRVSPAASISGRTARVTLSAMPRGSARCLMSFIENALKFTSVGSVRLHANASETDGRFVLRFDVTDTGVGLSKAVQERLFLPFVEIDKQAGEVGSTGSRAGDRQETRVADGRRGRLRKRGRPGHALLVHAAGRPRADERAGVKSEQRRSPQGVLSGHVLLLEDNAVNRMLIGSYLDEFGLTHEVASARRRGGAEPRRQDLRPRADGYGHARPRRGGDGQAHPQPARAVLASADRGADRQRAEGRCRRLSLPPAWTPMCRSRSAAASSMRRSLPSSAWPGTSPCSGWSRASALRLALPV